ncbi:MAG TPA: SRPBCC family protein [Kofleriaceae bacterium]
MRQLGWIGLGVGASLLGIAFPKRSAALGASGAALALGGIAALVLDHTRTIHPNKPVIFSVTINKSPREVYDFFRDFSRLPELMDYLESVEELDGARSRWIAKPFGGRTLEWQANLTEDRPGELIAWESVPTSKLKTTGRVTFAKAPGRDSTEVRVEMQLGIVGLPATDRLAKIFSKPQIKGDLRRLKQVIETGEVLVSDATITLRPRPAQPAELDEVLENDHVLKPIAKQIATINTNTNAAEAAKEKLPVTSDRVNANGGVR